MKTLKISLYLVSWILTIFLALRFGSSNVEWAWIYELRLPRVILALGVGASLSVAGLILQTVFQNPLSEPYTLGVSSGATLGAVMGTYYGTLGMTGSSFLGALAFSGVLQVISNWSRGRAVVILLGGVMLGFLGSSLVWLWMALSDTNGIQSAIIWIMGSLARAELPSAVFVLFASLFLCAWAWKKSRELDALLLGDEAARSMGVNADRLRKTLVLISSLLVALSVSGAGMIGFVGLVVPHLLRTRIGSRHNLLIPACAVVGGQFVVACDLISRWIARPMELPVGIVTAMIGAPLFLKLMMSRSREVA